MTDAAEQDGFRPGLDETTSVGFAGRYRADVEEDIVTLNTVVWRGGWFCLPGRRPELLYSFDLPDEFTVRQRGRGWTGKTISYDWRDGGFDLELRTTLPGPLFRLHSRELSLRFSYPNEPRTARNLEAGPDIGLQGGECDSRTWLLDADPHPVLLVASHPVRRVRIVSHRHWQFQFELSGARVFVLPLLDAADAPRDEGARRIWQELVRRPPLTCHESFVHTGEGAMCLRQRYPDASCAPRSPLMELARQRSSLVEGQGGSTLVKGWFGPYVVQAGERIETTIRTDWTQYAAVPRRAPRGELADLPEPLAFPGDGTWDLSLAGDRLMAWRVWAPLVPLLDEERRGKLLDRLDVPSPDEWRGDVVYNVETVNGSRWARHADLWQGVGDACYDFDWYNGLSLSGLARACECAEPSVAADAQALARECRDLRADMVRYMETYHDWRLGMSWSDAFGTLWNLDCAQNGLEGLLAEARMRRAEGDQAGAAHMDYLAGKTGAGIFAGLLLPDWLRENGFEMGDVPVRENTLGFKGMYPHVRVGFVEPVIRNPYILPRRLPQYSALLKLHGPVERLREFADALEENFPGRYRDWRDFWHSPDPDQHEIYRRRAIEISIHDGGGETGDEAAALHLVLPEITLRTWILGEDPDRVEDMYDTPLALPEQLLLRADYQLHELPAKDTPEGVMR
jgi:hypothetical protein